MVGPLSLPLCEGDQRDVYAPTLSHQPPPFYAQQLLPFASVYLPPPTMWYSGSSYCWAPDQRDVYARAPGWPTLPPTMPTIQPPYSATSPPGCWSSFTSSFQTVSTAVIITQSGHLQMHKLREHAEITQRTCREHSLHFTCKAHPRSRCDIAVFHTEWKDCCWISLPYFEHCSLRIEYG